MRIYIIKKKASSLRELAREEIEIPQVSDLKGLLTAAAVHEFRKLHDVKELSVLSQEEIRQQAELGRVSFAGVYNENAGDLEKAIQVMLQDFEDGLFRVYLNQEECTELTGPLEMHDRDEVVFIRLVMLAGRLW